MVFSSVLEVVGDGGSRKLGGLKQRSVLAVLLANAGTPVQIDRIVAEEACRQVRPWKVQYRTDPPISISVNISTTQFLQLELVSWIDHTLRQHGLYGRDIVGPYVRVTLGG